MTARMAGFGVLGILILGPASIGLANLTHWSTDGPRVAAALIGSACGQIGGYAVACPKRAPRPFGG